MGKVRITLGSVALGLVLVVFIAGFWFDTSDNQPTIFKKYSFKYFFVLCFATVLMPFVFLYLRQLFIKNEVVLSSGRKFFVRPCHKVLVLLICGIVFVVFAETWLIKKQKVITAEKKETLKGFHPFLQIIPKIGDEELPINQWGFRGEDIDKVKPKETFRIFVLGGSMIYCYFTPFEQSHCRILEKKLRANYPHINIEVQNAGMDWHTSQHSVIKFLFLIQDFEPDLVIICHGINDLYRSFSPASYAKGAYQDDYSHFLGPLSSVLDDYTSADRHGMLLPKKVKRLFSVLWFSDFRRHAAANLETIPINKWKSLKSFERNMQNFVDIVESKKIDLIVASQPYLYKTDMTDEEKETLWFPERFCSENNQKPDIPSMISGMEVYNRTSREIAKEKAVTFVDLEKRLQKSLLYFYDDVHLTEEGNQIIGEAFAEEIIKLKFIEKTFKNSR